MKSHSFMHKIVAWVHVMKLQKEFNVVTAYLSHNESLHSSLITYISYNIVKLWSRLFSIKYWAGKMILCKWKNICCLKLWHRKIIYCCIEISHFSIVFYIRNSIFPEQLVEEYTGHWQVPLPQLKVLRTALCYFTKATAAFPDDCQHVHYVLSSLAL